MTLRSINTYATKLNKERIMKHKCDHGCKHENVKYCEKCGKVHCLKCGMEWPQQEFKYYPPVYVPTIWSEPYIPYTQPFYTYTDSTTTAWIGEAN